MAIKTFVAGERPLAADLNDSFEELDDRAFPNLLSGNVAVLYPDLTNSFTSSVSFPSGFFSSAPHVVVSLSYNASAANSDSLWAGAQSISTSGFTLASIHSEFIEQPSGVVAYWVAAEV
jgi:hypothetical protein